MRLYLTYGSENPPEGFDAVRPEAIGSLTPECAEEVRGTCILEKVPCLISFMADLYKAMKVGANAALVCGYYGSASSFVSPLVRRSMSEYSMNWCSKEWREQNKFAEVQTDIDFGVAAGLATDQSLNLRSEEVQTLWRTTRLNCVLQVHFTLTKK